MRRNIEHVGWGQLTYEIRGIVAVAQQLQRMGVTITWENIGDPIEKGESMPSWMKDIIKDLCDDDRVYG